MADARTLDVAQFRRIARENGHKEGSVESRPIPGQLPRVARTDSARTVLATLAEMGRAAANDANEARNDTRNRRAAREIERAEYRAESAARAAYADLVAAHGAAYAEWAQNVARALCTRASTLRSAKQFAEVDHTLRVTAPHDGSSAPYAHALAITSVAPADTHKAILRMMREICDAVSSLARPIAQAGAYVRPNVATTSGAHVGAPLTSIRVETRIAPDCGESRKIADLADASDANRDLADMLRRRRASAIPAPIEDQAAESALRAAIESGDKARILAARAAYKAYREVNGLV